MTDTHLRATPRARDAAGQIDLLVAPTGSAELVRHPDGDGGPARPGTGAGRAA